MYDYLDLRQTERLKELVPYKALAPDADEIIEELERLNNIINELEKELNKKIEAIKTIKDMLGEEAKIVNPHIEVLETEYKYFLDKLKELKEE